MTVERRVATQQVVAWLPGQMTDIAREKGIDGYGDHLRSVKAPIEDLRNPFFELSAIWDELRAGSSAPLEFGSLAAKSRQFQWGELAAKTLDYVTLANWTIEEPSPYPGEATDIAYRSALRVIRAKPWVKLPKPPEDLLARDFEQTNFGCGVARAILLAGEMARLEAYPEERETLAGEVEALAMKAGGRMVRCLIDHTISSLPPNQFDLRAQPLPGDRQ